MQKEIQGLVNAYLTELGNEAVTITAIVRYVATASNERRKLLSELEKYFGSDNFREAAAPYEPGFDVQDKTSKLLHELELSFQKARMAGANAPLSRPIS